MYKVCPYITFLFIYLLSPVLIAQESARETTIYSEADSLITLFQNYHDPDNKWEILRQVSIFYADNNKDSAEVYAHKTLRFAEEFSSVNIARSYVVLGNFYTENKMYQKAIEVIDKAVEVSKNTNCLKCLVEAQNELFLIYYDRQDFQKALQYLRSNLRSSMELKDSVWISRSMTNMSLVFSQIPQNDSAKIYALKAIEVARPINEFRIVRFCFNNLGIINQNLNENNKAKENFKQALHYSKIGKDKEMEATSLYNVGESFILLNDLDSGIVYLNQAKQLFEELGRNDLMAYYYETMSDVLVNKNDFKGALEHFKIQSQIKDSIQLELYGKNLTEAETKFETKEKEAQILDQELTISRQRSAQKNITIGFAIFGLILLGLFQYFRYRHKLKEQQAQLSIEREHAEAEKLRELDQMKSRFLTNISHEFRTPLTLIKGPLNDIISGSVKGNLNKYYRLMNRNADRLLNLVNQLLELSKVEEGKVKLIVSHTDLCSFVRILALSFESLADKKEINYTLNGMEESLMAWFDSEKIEKILTNIISNAFKFTPEEGKIEISLRQISDKATISIVDSGVGISRKELDRIFDRFFSTGNVHHEDMPSSGIGLALTKELIELHHGEITIDSELGKGTTVIITIPISEAAYTKEEKLRELDSYIIPQTQWVEPKIAKTKKPKWLKTNDNEIILVVEDNAEVRSYIVSQLHKEYQILESTNGKEGFDKAKEVIPDLIVSDVMMPEMDGNELCRLIKSDETTNHIPIILLTAKAADQDKLEGLETGADSYMIKPFDSKELQVRVKNLITQRKQLRAKFSEPGTILKTNSKLTSRDQKFINNAIDLINEHMDDEDFSVEEFATMLLMSRSQLHRKIKALTDISPSVFIRTIRLERAKELLTQNVGNASEVAFMVGFNSTTYFAKCYKDWFGITPSESISY